MLALAGTCLLWVSIRPALPLGCHRQVRKVSISCLHGWGAGDKKAIDLPCCAALVLSQHGGGGAHDVGALFHPPTKLLIATGRSHGSEPHIFRSTGIGDGEMGRRAPCCVPQPLAGSGLGVVRPDLHSRGHCYPPPVPGAANRGMGPRLGSCLQLSGGSSRVCRGKEPPATWAWPWASIAVGHVQQGAPLPHTRLTVTWLQATAPGCGCLLHWEMGAGRGKQNPHHANPAQPPPDLNQQARGTWKAGGSVPNSQLCGQACSSEPWLLPAVVKGDWGTEPLLHAPPPCPVWLVARARWENKPPATCPPPPRKLCWLKARPSQYGILFLKPLDSGRQELWIRATCLSTTLGTSDGWVGSSTVYIWPCTLQT